MLQKVTLQRPNGTQISLEGGEGGFFFVMGVYLYLPVTTSEV